MTLGENLPDPRDQVTTVPALGTARGANQRPIPR